MKRQKRRQFLKNAGQLGLLGSLPWMTPVLQGCSSIDQYFTPESNYLTDRVVILGGGIAGLAAAYELKKLKIPYCLFEAGRQCGGRISSLKFAGQAGEIQTIEMGADYFDRRHTAIFQLAKELGLKIKEVDGSLSDAVILNGKVTGVKTAFQPLFQKIAQHRLEILHPEHGGLSESSRGASFDQMSVVHYLQSLELNLPPPVEVCLYQIIRSFWGVEPDELSALQFLAQFDHEAALSPFQTATRFQIQGGNQRLVDFLLARVDSQVPNYIVRLEHELVALRSRTLMTELVFRTPQGLKSYYCKKMICALPGSVLKKIEGWSELGARDSFVQGLSSIRMASHSKMALSYRNQFWNSSSPQNFRFQGGAVGDWDPQQVYNVTDLTSDESFLESQQSENLSGVLMIQVGGAKQKEILQGLQKQPRKALLPYWGESERSFQKLISYVNWQESPFIQGSRVVYSPSHFLRREEFWIEHGMDSFLSFAGEHISVRWPGTMEGAIVTGQQAARQMKELENA